MLIKLNSFVTLIYKLEFLKYSWFCRDIREVLVAAPGHLEICVSPSRSSAEVKTPGITYSDVNHIGKYDGYLRDDIGLHNVQNSDNTEILNAPCSN